MIGVGAVTATNTFGTNGLISRHSSVGSTFYDFDLSGNVAQRLSSSGAVAATDVDDAFGKRTTNNTSADSFSFCGQWTAYTDSETGFILLEHRYYDPASGRWLTRDPISYSGGINLYGYTRNSPNNSSDPTGNCPVNCGLIYSNLVTIIEGTLGAAIGAIAIVTGLLALYCTVATLAMGAAACLGLLGATALAEIAVAFAVAAAALLAAYISYERCAAVPGNIP